MAEIIVDEGRGKMFCAIYMSNGPIGRGVLEKSLPFVCRMPCGETYTLDRIEDLPQDDLPCSCGNPEHWFVKYMEEK
jgi:hypothetical protein